MLQERIGFIPWSTAYNGLVPDSIEESHLKVAAIYYDKLILPVGSNNNFRIIKSFVEEGLEEEQVRALWLALDDVLPQAEAQDLGGKIISGDHNHAAIWDKDGNIHRYLRGAIDEVIRQEIQGTRYALSKIKRNDKIGYFREANAIAIAAVGSSAAWSVVRNRIDCSLVAFYRTEILAAQHLLCGGDINWSKYFYKCIEANVPSVGQLSWEQIFELRKDKRLHSFRDWLARSSQSTFDASDKGYESSLNELWLATEQILPNVKSEIIKGIASNFPLPLPVNPFGIFQSAKDVIDGVQFNRKYEWLLFLHRLRDASSK